MFNSLYSSSSFLSFYNYCLINAKYLPCKSINSWCVPYSTILPSETTKMTSEFYTVVRRWAIVTVVLFLEISSKVAWMAYSLTLSNALVASSSNKIEGFFNSARAIAILYFWPPEN